MSKENNKEKTIDELIEKATRMRQSKGLLALITGIVATGILFFALTQLGNYAEVLPAWAAFGGLIVILAGVPTLGIFAYGFAQQPVNAEVQEMALLVRDDAVKNLESTYGVRVPEESAMTIYHNFTAESIKVELYGQLREVEVSRVDGRWVLMQEGKELTKPLNTV